MKHIINRHTISFKNAFYGLKWAFETQPNFRVHSILALAALFLGMVLSIAYFEWLVIVLIIIGGLVVELINTAIESTTDAIDRNIRPDIKIAKDVSAAAMLVYAIGATVLAYVIFAPKILSLLAP